MIDETKLLKTQRNQRDADADGLNKTPIVGAVNWVGIAGAAILRKAKMFPVNLQRGTESRYLCKYENIQHDKQHGHINNNSFSVESSHETRTDFENISDNKKGFYIYIIDKSTMMPHLDLVYIQAERNSNLQL